MGAIARQVSTAREGGTLGRLGGLSRREADRGERALWLSGDGYRAALFHLGALTRLNELGLLAQIGTVGAVSGGSILAALLATRVSWPLTGAFRDWPEEVAEPLRAIARRNARARAILRKPFPGGAAEAALEERYARELVSSLGGEARWGPRFVFGASGLTLSGLAAGWEDSVEWEIGGAVHPPGYRPALVDQTIVAVRTDLDAFSEAEQAVLENHGYLLADAALRKRGMVNAGGIEVSPPEPPHPRWMNEERVREALTGSSRRTRVGRLRPRRGQRAARSPQPSAGDLNDLLERYRPLLQYDSLECFRADPVSTICSLALPGRCNSLHRADGALIAAVEPSGEEAQLSLDFLGAPAYANGALAMPGDYLDECGGSHAADASLARQQEGHVDVVYGRARLDDHGRLWLQYWLFFYYDDKGLLGVQQHEGDWEVFQLRIGEKGQPDAATFARHSSADALSWDQLELASEGGEAVPVLFLARGSHSPLPRPGSFEAPVVPDHNDALGPRVRPRLEVIADDGPRWAAWPGRWGSTRRREYFEADSPQGPRGHACWWDPAELHREARPWRGPVPAKRALPGAPPTPVRIEARREGDLAVVGYSFARPDPGQREPARIVAAPFADGGEVGGAQPFPVEGRNGSFAVQLPAGQEWLGVRACVASDRGIAGTSLAAAFASYENASRKRERAG
jgi:hypothetical protein